MRLIQRVGLEIERLVNDYTALVGEMEGLERILAEHQRVLDIIKADCEEMKQRYSGSRLTRIEETDEEINLEALIQVEDMAVTISHQGYAKRVPLKTYRQQGRGGKGIRASDAKDDDFIETLLVASTHDDMLVFTDTGRVFKMKVYELPEMRRNAKGRPLVNLLDFKEGERPRAYLAIKDFESGSNYLTFVSRGGIVKRTALKDYRNVHRSGIIAVGLKEGDALLDVVLTTGTDDVLVVTAGGMAIRFNEEDARLMGRAAAGVRGIELEAGDEVIGVVGIPMARDADGDLMTAVKGLSLLTVTENGYGKRTDVDEYRVQPETGKPRSQSRGGKGRADIKTSARNGRSVAAIGVREGDDVMVITQQGQAVRMAAASISQYGRATQGVRVASLNESDKVVAVAPVVERESDETPGADGGGA
jgi:DNA gyrase subunit A